jgi:phasin
MMLAPAGIIATASSTQRARMIETPVGKTINEGAEVTVMLTMAISAPLICIKAFCNCTRGMMPTPSSASAIAGQSQCQELVMSDANLPPISPYDAGRGQRAPSKGQRGVFRSAREGPELVAAAVADQAKQYCGYLQRNVTATFDLGDKLIQAKDMQEAAKVQSEFFQDQMRSLTDHARSLGESAMKAATSAFTPKS